MSISKKDKRYLFIANPVSGNGRRLKQLKVHEAWVRQNLPGSVWKWTNAPKHAVELASNIEDGISAAVVFGGDGTFNEVVNGIALVERSKRLPLAFFSAGTGGDFYRSIKEAFPVRNDLEWLKNPREVSIDFGKATLSNGQGKKYEHYFLNIADLGLPGEVVRRVCRSRKLFGPFEYPRATFAATLGFKPPMVKIRGMEADHPRRQLKCEVLAVVAANGRYFGGGMCIAPEGRLDDEKLEWVIIEKISYFSMLKEFPYIYLKKKIPHPKIHYGRGHALEIEAEEGMLPLDIDGEYRQASKVRFEVIPKGLRLLLPLIR